MKKGINISQISFSFEELRSREFGNFFHDENLLEIGQMSSYFNHLVYVIMLQLTCGNLPEIGQNMLEICLKSGKFWASKTLLTPILVTFQLIVRNLPDFGQMSESCIPFFGPPQANSGTFFVCFWEKICQVSTFFTNFLVIWHIKSENLTKDASSFSLFNPIFPKCRD